MENVKNRKQQKRKYLSKFYRESLYTYIHGSSIFFSDISIWNGCQFYLCNFSLATKPCSLKLHCLYSAVHPFPDWCYFFQNTVTQVHCFVVKDIATVCEPHTEWLRAKLLYTNTLRTCPKHDMIRLDC